MATAAGVHDFLNLKLSVAEENVRRIVMDEDKLGLREGDV
jgi:hypothetical protein